MVLINTSMGMIQLELDYANTPKTVENFLSYVKAGFYDQTIFHRVIADFMIQGGGFATDLVQKSAGDMIENEADKGGLNKRGTIAMARTSDPHSATAQFFINVKDNDFLNFRGKQQDAWGYCAFGRVVEGMDIVDKINLAQTTAKSGHHDVPVDNIVVESVTLSEK